MKQKQPPQKTEAAQKVSKITNVNTPFLEQQRQLNAQLAPVWQITEGAQKVSKITSVNTPFLEQQRRLNAELAPVLQITEAVQKVQIWRQYADKLQWITEIIKQQKETTKYICEQAEAAESNFFYKMQAAELEQGNKENKQLKKEIEQLKAHAKELEKTIKIHLKLLPNRKPTTPKTRRETLNAYITPSQIMYLKDNLNGIFEATPEQWQELFSDNGKQLKEPIKAAAVADISVLLYHLQKNELINTTTYAAKIEHLKAFCVNRQIITSRQLRKTKENYNFPDIGANYEKIKKVIKAAMY